MSFSGRYVLPSIPTLTDLGAQGWETNLPPLDSLGAGEPRWGRYTGIKALMLAVLEEAIRNYLGAKTPLRNEAGSWIDSASRRSPFAFCTVCETLGLEAGAVRTALQRMQAENVSAREAVGRNRPNVRNLGRVLPDTPGRRRRSIAR